jgi:hypothetical protein
MHKKPSCSSYFPVAVIAIVFKTCTEKVLFLKSAEDDVVIMDNLHYCSQSGV